MVAQGGHIGGIQAKLFLAHHIDWHMGEIEVFQRDGTDVPGIGHPNRISVTLAIRSCFRPVPVLRGYSFGEDILLIKEGLKVAQYLVDGEYPFMERRQNGDQHMRIVLKNTKLASL